MVKKLKNLSKATTQNIENENSSYLSDSQAIDRRTKSVGKILETLNANLSTLRRECEEAERTKLELEEKLRDKSVNFSLLKQGLLDKKACKRRLFFYSSKLVGRFGLTLSLC